MATNYVLTSGSEYVKELCAFNQLEPPRTHEARLVLTDDIEKALKINYTEARVLSKYLGLDYSQKD